MVKSKPWGKGHPYALSFLEDLLICRSPEEWPIKFTTNVGSALGILLVLWHIVVIFTLLSTVQWLRSIIATVYLTCRGEWGIWYLNKWEWRWVYLKGLTPSGFIIELHVSFDFHSGKNVLVLVSVASLTLTIRSRKSRTIWPVVLCALCVWSHIAIFVPRFEKH